MYTGRQSIVYSKEPLKGQFCNRCRRYDPDDRPCRYNPKQRVINLANDCDYYEPNKNEGDNKMGAEAIENIIIYTVVSRFTENGKDVAYGVVAYPEGQMAGYRATKVSRNDLILLLRSGREVQNVGLQSNGEIVFTNGSRERYTEIDEISSMPVGNSHGVVLSRVERASSVVVSRVESSSHELLGYVVIDATGIVKVVSVKEAVAMHKGQGFSNGKLMPTNEGQIISSIGGNYPIALYSKSKPKAVENFEGKVNIVFVCATSVYGKTGSYAGMIMHSPNLDVLSEVAKKALKANDELVNRLIQMGVESDEANKLRMFRAGASGYYGVFALKDALQIISELKTGEINQSQEFEGVAVSALYIDSSGTDEASSMFNYITGEIQDTIAEPARPSILNPMLRKAEGIAADFMLKAESSVKTNKEARKG